MDRYIWPMAVRTAAMMLLGAALKSRDVFLFELNTKKLENFRKRVWAVRLFSVEKRVPKR